MGYKRKIKSTVDISRAVAKKTGAERKQAESIALSYVEKIKKSVLEGTKITLNEFGSFELTRWNSNGIYDISSQTKVERQIKTILFRASPALKKKISD